MGYAPFTYGSHSKIVINGVFFILWETCYFQTLLTSSQWEAGKRSIIPFSQQLPRILSFFVQLCVAELHLLLYPETHSRYL